MTVNFLRLQSRSATLGSFSSFCEPGDYMLYAIFFYQFQFESSHHHHHHHQHLHHYQHRIVTIIKRILFDHPSTNHLSFFLPGEKYHIKARLTLM